MNKLYSLKQDHENIKKQIKVWERTIDIIVNCMQSEDLILIRDHKACLSDLENISQEMLAINL